MLQRGFLSGRKTYVAAALTLLAAWAGFAIGEPVLGQDALTLADALEMTAVAVIGTFLRAGVSKAEPVFEESDEE